MKSGQPVLRRCLGFAQYLYEEEEGTISYQVTGSRQYSQDLPQGGLEVPCLIKYLKVLVKK